MHDEDVVCCGVPWSAARLCRLNVWAFGADLPVEAKI